jgi:hypothetical protein
MALLSGYFALGSALSANNVLTELSGNGYARQAATLTLDVNGGVINISGVTFGPDVTAAWTTATYAAIFDAATAGNMIAFFPIPGTTLAVGQSYTIPSCYVTLNGTAQSLFVAGGAISPGTPLGTLTDLQATGLTGATVTSGPATLGLSSTLGLSATSVNTILTYASSLTPAFTAGSEYTVTLTGNMTLNLPTGMVPGTLYRLFLIQDGTGSRTLTLGAGFKTAGGAPTLTTTANAIDRLDIFWDGTTAWNNIFKAFA